MKTAQEVHEIDPAKVKVFMDRAREASHFALSVEDTRRRGQIMPGKVRDISHWPKEERRREDGGLYIYELMSGQGRLLRARELGRKFRAFIVRATETQAVDEFLLENLNREDLPQATRAQLIKTQLDAGTSPEEIARRYSMTVGHVVKYRRILDKTASGLEKDVAAMAMNDAEAFTALPAGHQTIVMDVFRETKPAAIREVVKRARKVAEESGGELSRRALAQSIERTNEDLREQRARLKLTRLHWSLGVQNLQVLLADKKFRKALDAEGINVAKFERLTAE